MIVPDESKDGSVLVDPPPLAIPADPSAPLCDVAVVVAVKANKSKRHGVFGGRSAGNHANVPARLFCALFEVDDDAVGGHDRWRKSSGVTRDVCSFELRFVVAGLHR